MKLFSYVLLFTALIVFNSCSKKQLVVEPIKTLQTETQVIPVFRTEGLEQFLNKKDDKIHLVNFWATWCGPCVKELPGFEQITEEMGQEVDVTLVSLDFEDELEQKLVPFVNKKQLKSHVVVVIPTNEAEMMEYVSPNWQSGIPATLIYNKNKRYFIEGELTHEELLAEIEKFKL